MFCIPTVGFGQEFKNVQLPKPAEAEYTYSQVEPSIAISPKNQKRMIAGSVMNDYYYSKNGGKRWKSSSIYSKFGVNGDPVMMIDSCERYYYFHLSNPSGFGHHLDRIVCQTSDNIKGKWSEGSAPEPVGTKVQDKHWVVQNPENGEIYMTWTQFDAYNSSDPKDSSFIVFSKSADRGETWSTPIQISKLGGDCLDDDNTVEGAVPAVGPNGEIYVAWSGPHGLRFTKSLDGGETWLEQEMKVGDQPLGWTINVPGIFRCNGLPILKCDLSNGPNRGTLYLNWADQRNGEDDTDIWVAKSTDGGESWSDPIRVNQDAPGKHQFFTWMDIDQSSGEIYFVYYDRRNYSDNRTDTYIAYSNDGCTTFQEKCVSESPFIPNNKVFFGDYNNIAAVNGVIRPIWSRYDNGKITLWTGLVDGESFSK